MPVLIPIGPVPAPPRDAVPPVLTEMPMVPTNRVIEMVFNDAVSSGTSPFTASRQTQEWLAAKWWGAKCTLPPMHEATARAWCAWLAACRGIAGAFRAGDSSVKNVVGTTAGVPLVDGADQRGFSLKLKGFTANGVRVLKTGYYLGTGAAGIARLYIILADVNADADGKAVVKIWPGLRESPADSEAVVTTGAVGTFTLASNVRSFTVDEAKTYGISFEAREWL